MSFLRFLIVALVASAISVPLAASEHSWTHPLPIGSTMPLPADATEYAIAFSGEVYLVAAVRTGNVLVTRLDADGRRLDAYPVALSHPAESAGTVDVAWNGQSFLVIWRSDAIHVAGRMVATNGDVGPRQLIARAERPTISVSSNGDGFLVSGGTTATLAEVSADGDIAGIVDADLVRALDVHSIASSDGRYSVLASEPGWEHLSLELLDVGPQRRLRESGSVPWLDNPTISFLGDRFLVVGWLDQSFVGFTIGRSGDVLEPIRTLSPHPAFQSWPLPHVLPDGSGGALIVRAIGETSEIVRWDSSSASPSPTTLSFAVDAVSGPTERPLVIYTSTTPRAAWQVFLSSEGDVATEPMPVVMAAPDQRPADLAVTSEGWFAAWRHYAGSGQPIRGAILDRDGRTLREFEISASDDIGHHPSVAAGPRVVLVTWSSIEKGLLGRRFTHGGVPLDSEPFPIDPDAFSGWGLDSSIRPGSTWNGRYFLIVYGSGSPSGGRVMRISPDGTSAGLAPLAFPSSARDTVQHSFRIASSRGISLVVWEDGVFPYECRITCPTPMAPSRVEGVLLDVEGNPLQSEAILLSSDDHWLGFGPSVSTDGTSFLVSWRTLHSVEARLLSRSGEFAGGPIVIRETMSEETYRVGSAPHAAGFAVVWDEHTGSARTRVIRSQTISADGDLIGSIGPDAFVDVTGNTWPAPALHHRNGRLMLLFSSWSRELGGTSRNWLISHESPRPRRRGTRPTPPR